MILQDTTIAQLNKLCSCRSSIVSQRNEITMVWHPNELILAVLAAPSHVVVNGNVNLVMTSGTTSCYVVVELIFASLYKYCRISKWNLNALETFPVEIGLQHQRGEMLVYKYVQHVDPVPDVVNTLAQVCCQSHHVGTQLLNLLLRSKVVQLSTNLGNCLRVVVNLDTQLIELLLQSLKSLLLELEVCLNSLAGCGLLTEKLVKILKVTGQNSNLCCQLLKVSLRGACLNLSLKSCNTRSELRHIILISLFVIKVFKGSVQLSYRRL